MVETAAHMVEHVFPAVAVRQWVAVLPKRLRYCLCHDAGCVNWVVMFAPSEVQCRTSGAAVYDLNIAACAALPALLR